MKTQRIIWLLLAASFVVILNETIMSVAIPELMIDLHIDARAAQWLTTGFMLTMAVVIPITGFLLQRYNTRPVFLAAMTLFSTGTFIAGIAPGFEILLVGRVVQACGTAIMMPLLMTTVMTLVPASSRGKTMGNISIVIAVAPAIGPTISGIILSTLSWRWMFWIVLPIALVMLYIGWRQVENVTEPKVIPIDLLSVLLSGLGFGGLIYGLSQVGTKDATLQMWVAFAVGGVALLTFILRQLRLQKIDRALLDLRTFKSKIFTISMTTMVINTIALFGTIILLPIYLQQVLGLAPVQVGMMLLPGGVIMGLLAPIVGRFYDRFGPKPLVIPGSVIVASVMWVFSTLNENTSPFMVLGSHFVLSIGLALMFTPLFSAGLGAVRPSLYSHASATVGTVQQVAGAIGTAMFITLMSIKAPGDITQIDPSVLAEGVRISFFAGALIAMFSIFAAFFLKKPADIIEEE